MRGGKRMKKLVTILSATVVIIVVSLTSWYYIKQPKIDVYIADMYTINSQLILVGTNMDHLVVSTDTKKIDAFVELDTMKIDFNLLEESAIYFKASGVIQVKEHINTFYELGNKVYGLYQEEDGISFRETDKIINFEAYNTEQINEINQPFRISDFLAQDTTFQIAITTGIDNDVFVGFSHAKTNKIYQYEMVEQQKDATYKKNTYKLAATQEEMQEIIFFSRVLPSGENKSTVKSYVLNIADLLDGPIQTDEQTNEVVEESGQVQEKTNSDLFEVI